MLHRGTFAVTFLAAALLGLFIGLHAADADLLGRDEFVDETSHTLSLDAAGHIYAATPDGHITVEAWDKDEVSLLVRKRVRTRKGMSEAEAQFAKMRVDIDQSADRLNIQGDVPEYHLGIGYSYSIDYEMHVPGGVGMELRTSDGMVKVEGVSGKVSARSSDGDISVANIGEAELKTSDGSIRAETIEGDLSAVTSDGDIRISDVGGDAYVKSSDGDVDCRDIGGLLVVQLSDGDAHMQAIKGGVSAKSSDGHLVVRDVSGPVELKTSDGDIELALAQPLPMSRVTCQSSDGNIRLRLNDSAAFTLEAKTSDGRVNVSLPGEFQRDKEGRRVQGFVNGGGPAVNLRTSDGSITIDPV